MKIATVDDTAKQPFVYVQKSTTLNSCVGQQIKTFTVRVKGDSGSDYAATRGALTFAPGETFKLVTVQVKGDTTMESNENFFLSLNTPKNATIALSKGTGTIENDD